MLQDALASIRLKVTVDGKEYKSDLRPGDLVRYERHAGKSLFGGIDKDEAEKAQAALASGTDEGTREAAAFVAQMGMGMEDMFFLAYLGVRRQIPDLEDFDDFLGRAEEVAFVGDEVPKGQPSPT